MKKFHIILVMIVLVAHLSICLFTDIFTLKLSSHIVVTLFLISSFITILRKNEKEYDKFTSYRMFSLIYLFLITLVTSLEHPAFFFPFAIIMIAPIAIMDIINALKEPKKKESTN